MRTDWIPIKFQPKEIGTYLVTTANRKIRLDRWDGTEWGLSKPRHEIKQIDKGRYKPHIAWTTLPPAARKEDME